jgi:hypothetical protein
MDDLDNPQPVKLPWWRRILLWIAGAIVGFPAGVGAIVGLMNLSPGGGRSCPGGWVVAALGIVLLFTGIALPFASKGSFKTAGALLAGFGAGSIPPAAYIIYFFQAFPSC